MRWIILTLVSSMLLVFPQPGHAQEREVPYWASLRASEVNMRVGPSQDYPIEWVYKRQGLPVKVLRLQEGWRLISDPDGTQGWVVARLLDPERAALVVGEGLAQIRIAPGVSSQLKWNVEPGVVGKLGKCDAGWCEFDAAGHKGWIREDRLWGVGEP
ncbi:SH3 domain-containing protein [Altererythrobacter sp. Z27]|uniref:SH3 domain-containing protein n=1 Tax=Altererythrobacter sp. Z27 TaxID=3461147 RepID=UPI004044CD24